VGLSGHSDADVLTHAVIDAVLGAIGEGDIGTLFPDDDAKYSGVSSMLLLAEVLDILSARGYAIINIDTVIVCDKPKLSPYIGAIKEALSKTAGLSPGRVGVKATSTEGMGFTGRGEGIAAYAVVLLKENGKPG